MRRPTRNAEKWRCLCFPSSHGSNDCVQASLTESESMLMALCSLHSNGNAPCGIHRIPHPSTSIAPKGTETQAHALQTHQQSAFLRPRHMHATCTPQLRPQEQNGGMVWHGNARVDRQDHKRPSYSTDCLNSDTTAQTSCLIHVPSLPLCTMVSFSSTFKGECAHPRCARCLCSSSPCTCSVQLVKRSSKLIVVDSCVA